VNGGRGDEVLGGGAGDDKLLDGDGNGPVGEGNDVLLGGAGNDTLRARWGEDTLLGGEGDDRLVSRADGGEPIIAQDPDAPLYFDGHTIEASSDVLTGGTGGALFVFRTDINATEDMVRKHTMDNGNIHWHGVAGENDNLHDHWAERFGNDIITDFNRAEGDAIRLVGHTIALQSITHVDADGDGADDYSVLTVISDQGGNGGAHDQDVLGTVTVYGDLVDASDVAVNANPAFGVTDTLDQWLDLFG